MAECGRFVDVLAVGLLRRIRSDDGTIRKSSAFRSLTCGAALIDAASTQMYQNNKASFKTMFFKEHTTRQQTKTHVQTRNRTKGTFFAT